MSPSPKSQTTPPPKKTQLPPAALKEFLSRFRVCGDGGCPDENVPRAQKCVCSYSSLLPPEPTGTSAEFEFWVTYREPAAPLSLCCGVRPPALPMSSRCVSVFLPLKNLAELCSILATDQGGSAHSLSSFSPPPSPGSRLSPGLPEHVSGFLRGPAVCCSVERRRWPNASSVALREHLFFHPPIAQHCTPEQQVHASPESPASVWLGFTPKQLAQIPSAALAFVGEGIALCVMKCRFPQPS